MRAVSGFCVRDVLRVRLYYQEARHIEGVDPGMIQL